MYWLIIAIWIPLLKCFNKLEISSTLTFYYAFSGNDIKMKIENTINGMAQIGFGSSK